MPGKLSLTGDSEYLVGLRSKVLQIYAVITSAMFIGYGGLNSKTGQTLLISVLASSWHRSKKVDRSLNASDVQCCGAYACASG